MRTQRLSGIGIVTAIACLGPSRLPAQRVADVQTIHAERATLGSPTIHRMAPWPRAEARRTYWLEGGAVGGLLLGAIGYSLGQACPKNTGSCPSPPVSFGIGAVVGFVVGAFIGDAMEKTN